MRLNTYTPRQNRQKAWATDRVSMCSTRRCTARPPASGLLGANPYQQVVHSRLQFPQLSVGQVGHTVFEVGQLGRNGRLHGLSSFLRYCGRLGHSSTFRSLRLAQAAQARTTTGRSPAESLPSNLPIAAANVS